MSFPRTSAELVKNTSTVSPSTLATVKDALDNLQGRAPTSLPVPITEGGTGQTTANAAFNALSPQTTRGDLITRDATNDIRLPLGAAGTLLRSDGTDAVYSTFSAYLDAIFTGEANGDLIQRTAGTWTNVTVPTMLATLLTARGQIIRRGSSAPEALAAQTANTFVGGDGTDVTTRTAAQVLASLGLGLNTWSLSDDTATSFALPNTSTFVPVLVWGSGTNTGTANPWLLWFLRGSGSPAIRTEISGTGMTLVDGTTGVLTGTTGVDTHFTISAANDGNMYLENRSGSTRSGRALFLWGA